jgi:YD repeat-containing protein
LKGTVTTWSYDNTYQLAREQRSGDDGFDLQYAYDAAGNRTLLTQGTSVTTSVYDDANRITTATTGSAITTYGHDAAGNRTLVHEHDGSMTYYSWDAAGRLATAEPPAGTVTMVYNADGQAALDSILNDPARAVKQRPGKPGEWLLQINRPDGSGVIFKWNGTDWQFSHFAENLF